MKYTHKIFWNSHYTGAQHAFDTTRKSGEIVNTIGQENITDPYDMVTESEAAIKEAITEEYYDALKYGEPLFLSESNGFTWDYGIYEMAINSTAGVLSAVSEALDNNTVAGSLSSGLHHADQRHGSGFCTVNGLAVASNWLHGHYVTILDFDAHCGGGTVNMLRHLQIDQRVEQYDLSTNNFDSYNEDDTHNIIVSTNDADYIRNVDKILNNINPSTEIVLYNAGTDPYPTISHDTLAERDATVFQYCKDNNIPCAYVLAGGYTMSQTMKELVQSHINTLDAAERTR
jgi:acetoin utilization deacetylase AcuC-like enzyme